MPRNRHKEIKSLKKFKSHIQTLFENQVTGSTSGTEKKPNFQRCNLLFKHVPRNCHFRVLAEDSDEETQYSPIPGTQEPIPETEEFVNNLEVRVIPESDIEDEIDDLQRDIKNTSLSPAKYGFTQYERATNKIAADQYSYRFSEDDEDIDDPEPDKSYEVSERDTTGGSVSNDGSSMDEDASCHSSSEQEDDGPDDPHDDPSSSSSDDGSEDGGSQDSDISEEPNWTYQFAKKLLGLRARTHIDHNSMKKVLGLIVECKDIIAHMEDVPSYRTLRRMVEKDEVHPLSSWTIKNVGTGEIVTDVGLHFDNKGYGDKKLWNVENTWTRITLEEALTMFDEIHEGKVGYIHAPVQLEDKRRWSTPALTPLSGWGGT